MFTSKYCSSSVLTGVLLSLLLSLAASAQTITGSIGGMVTDPNGGAVAGAAVSLINDQTKAARVANANEEGRFSFAAMQPGLYTLRVEHQGFQTLLKQNVVLSANESLALGELKLQ